MTDKSYLYDVVAGSYDGYIYGMSALIENNSDSPNTYKSTLVQQFVERAHSTHIKVLSSSWPQLATAGIDDVINLYNLETLREVGTLHQHLSKIQHMQFLPSSHLISLSEDGDLIVWDTHSWRPIRTLALGEKGKSFTYFSVHPSEKLLFAISPSDSILALCDLRTARCAYSMKLKDRPVEIECSPCGDMYALVHSNTLSLYGMHSMDAVCSLHLRDNVEINCVMFLSKNMLAFGGEIDFIKIVTIDKFVTNESEFEAHENRVKSLKGTLPFLFSSSTDGKVKVWYLKDATRIDLQLIGEINLGVRLTSLTVSCISEFISNDTDRDELQAISYEDKFKKMALYYKRKNYKTRNRTGVCAVTSSNYTVC
ncbi:P21-activated protein kinase-interacting protein 1 [Oopsacas minuta]|uniref:P21-activated protein kinase-interacting protein 1 n=1 Tax=Oopsacas minuta TaxID=111878 RepID=A0AAV7JU29_9METZ|nr:P21-activated protein kinase-interacting protein 1 [Oopsacas minuta]